MRKRKFIKVSMILLLVVAAAAAATILAWNRLTAGPRLVSTLRERFHEEVHPGFDFFAGNAELTPSLLFSVSGGAIKAPEAEQPLVSWDEALAELNPRLFLRRHWVPQRVTVDRPTVNIEYLPHRGRWNIEEFLEHIEVEDPRFRELLRQGIHLENANVQLTSEEVFGDLTSRNIAGIDAEIKRTSFSPGAWKFSGRIAKGYLRGTEFRGIFDGNGLELNVNVSRLKVDRAFLDWIPRGLNLESHFRPRGIASGDFALSVASTDDGYGPAWSGRVHLEDMSATSRFYPVRIDNLSGVVEIVGEKANFRDITGLIDVDVDGASRKAPVKISGSTEMENWATTLNITARGLPLTEDILRHIPGSGEKIRESLRASGTADLDLTIRSKERGGTTDFFAVTALHDVRIAPADIPFPIEKIYGTLLIDDNRVRLVRISGKIPREDSNGRLLIDGAFNMDGEAENVRIEAENIRFTQALLAELPGADAGLLQTMDPEGAADLVLTVRKAVDAEKADYRAGIKFSDTSVTAPELPFRFVDLEGELFTDGNAVHLRDVSGRLPQEENSARISVSGKFRTDGKAEDLKMTFSGLEVNRAFLEKLPDARATLPEEWKPALRVDGEMKLKDSASDFAGIFHLRSGQVEVDFLPVPLEEISGTVHLSGGALRIESLRGALGSLQPPAEEKVEPEATFIDVRGKYDLELEKGRFRVDVQDMNLHRDIMESIPGWGGKLWDTLRPEGLVSIGGSVAFGRNSSQQDGFSYHLDTELKRVSAQWHAFPLRLSSLSGNLIVSHDSIHAPNVHGMVGGGKATLQGFVSGLDGPGDVRYEGTVDFQRLDIRKLIREMTGRERDVAGKLSGMLDIAGRMGEQPTLKGQGELSLTEGRIWQAPVFLGIIDILHLSRPGASGNFDRGQLQYYIRDDYAYIQHFELRSPSAEMTGWGTIRLEDAELDLTIVAASVPEGGIPLLSPAIRTILRPVQRELIRIRVTGPVDDPDYSYDAIGRLTRPAEALYDLFTFPMRFVTDNDDEG